MGNDNILIVVVLAVVAYFILIPQKTLEGIKHKITKGTFGTGTIPCTRGDLYRSNTAVCDAGYEATTWFGLTDCKCISGIYTNSPQTPPPTSTVQKCPWDPNLLIGDRRCGTQEIDYPTSPTDPGCVSGEYYLDIPTGTFQRCP